MSFLGVLNLRWTSLGPLSSTKFVSTVTSWAGAWLANRLEVCKTIIRIDDCWSSYRYAKVCSQEYSLGVQVVGDVNDNRRRVHNWNDIVNGDVNAAHSLPKIIMINVYRCNENLLAGRQTAWVPLDVIKTGSNTKGRNPNNK